MIVELIPEEPTDPEDPDDPSTPVDPEDPTDPTDPSKPTDPDQPSDTRGGKDQQTGGADQSTDGGDKSKTVQTGDTTNVAGTAAVCVIALGMAGAVIYIRRKRQ